MASSRSGAVAMLATIAVLIAGVFQLLALRFARGDVYPPYSSLRADALGTGVLYEALAGIDGVRVERNIEPLGRLVERSGNDAILLYVGVASGLLRRPPTAVSDALESFATAGGRVVIGLLPLDGRPLEDAPEHDGDHRDEGTTASDAALPASGAALAEGWGLKLRYEPLSTDPEGDDDALADASTARDLAVSWHSALYFELLGDAWRTVLSFRENPVLIERAFGRGSIVLAADTYFLSNEAMRYERRPELLQTIFGAGRRFVFEETHLGITESPGVAALARRYRLHGLLIGLVMLALLHVWRRAVPFLPPVPSAPEHDALVSGKDSSEGLINLLRRSLPKDGLVTACVSEWRRACGHERPDLASTASRVERIARDASAPGASPDAAVVAYRSIARIVNPRRKHSVS